MFAICSATTVSPAVKVSKSKSVQSPVVIELCIYFFGLILHSNVVGSIEDLGASSIKILYIHDFN